jgi:hypothetical protein
MAKNSDAPTLIETHVVQFQDGRKVRAARLVLPLMARHTCPPRHICLASRRIMRYQVLSGKQGGSTPKKC